MISGERLTALKRAAVRSSVDQFASEFGGCLADNFQQVFGFAKKQKLLMKFRDAEAIRTFRHMVLPATSFLSGPQRSSLENLFDVCEFVQNVFSFIDQQSGALPFRDLHPDFVPVSVLNSLEATITSTERRLASL